MSNRIQWPTRVFPQISVTDSAVHFLAPEADLKEMPKSPSIKSHRHIVASLVGHSEVRLWGLTSENRYQRALDRAGIPLVGLEFAQQSQVPAVALFRADWVLDETLIIDLTQSEPFILMADDGTALGAIVTPLQAQIAATAILTGDLTTLDDLPRRTPEQLSSSFQNALRKRSTPYAMPLQEHNLRAIEWRMFIGAYKGATDFVTKFLWPPVAVHATRWCAAREISPNTVTWVSLGFTLLTFILFWNGWFITGCFSAWVMTFLDTVDGKLARVTLTSSKLGEVFDHGIDHIHPPFWYWAWAIGLQSVGKPLTYPDLIIFIVIGGYILGRMQEGFFLFLFKIEIHIWQKLDTAFRLFTARRNPNVFILMVFALLGAPDYGLIAVAVWTLISLTFHFVRIYQAWKVSQDRPIISWMADPPIQKAYR